MFDALAAALAFFYDVWPNYAGAIILLTLAIMLVLTPLSIKSTARCWPCPGSSRR
jgi:membrane protein insertase Oxa1/YidC/SpoIIIJ